MKRLATCHCGEMVVVCSGEPRKISMCHCADCQRRTGSAFSVALFFPRSQVNLEGCSPGYFERGSASGYPVKFCFCRRCGSNVYWEASRMPDLVAVALGAFADKDFAAPVQSVWTKDKHHWLSLPETIIQFEDGSASTVS
jgi:hypothetical protein